MSLAKGKTFRSAVSSELRPALESSSNDPACWSHRSALLFPSHEKVYFYNIMPEKGLEDLLNL